MEAVIGRASVRAGRRQPPRFAAGIDALVLGGEGLVHYRRLADRPDRPWLRLQVVSAAATGPGELHRLGRALLAVVPEGEATTAYRLGPDGWGQLPTPPLVRRRSDVEEPPDAAALGIPPDRLRAVAGFRVRGRGAALADEDGSVFEYRLDRSGRWRRVACLRLADPGPFRIARADSVKLAQLSGELDATPARAGDPVPTLSRSLSTSGVLGTDLGVRFEHEGRSYLLFGDTHWTRPWLGGRDALAELTETGPRPGLPGLRFHGSPLKLRGRGVTRREYDVPLDAISHDGRVVAWFTSNHFGDGQVMGRSVLSVSAAPWQGADPAARRRPVRFDALGTFSELHFVNVSVQRVPASLVPGCRPDGSVVLVWGSGPYRASEPRLALLDQDALSDLDGPDPGLPRPGFWDGAGWSGREEDAAALFSPAALGELSVRYVPALGRYLLLAGSGPEDPIGPAVTLRTAAQPWGPWSDRIRLLDWMATGMAADPHARFIKASPDDPVGDRIFGAQAKVTGAAYAPYFFDATLAGDDVVLRYTLSTWNPYQVVLMEHRLPLSCLGQGVGQDCRPRPITPERRR